LSEELNNLHNQTYEIVELQVQPNMSETIAEDGNNVGTSGTKSIATTDDLLDIPGGMHSDLVQPETSDASGATAAFGLEIFPDHQVNGVFNDFVAGTVYQGVAEPLVGTEKEVILADRTHAPVDMLDGDQLQDVPSDMQRATDAKVSSSDVVCSVQDCAQAANNLTVDFNHFGHNDVDVIENNEVPTSEITGVECNQDFAGIAQPIEDENTLSAMGDNSGLQENNMKSLIDIDMVHGDGLKECNVSPRKYFFLYKIL
jgi:cohesin complex subunit SCC1